MGEVWLQSCVLKARGWKAWEGEEVADFGEELSRFLFVIMGNRDTP